MIDEHREQGYKEGFGGTPICAQRRVGTHNRLAVYYTTSDVTRVTCRRCQRILATKAPEPV
jgi:hypothetical protein